jgi:hypothetical protein
MAPSGAAQGRIIASGAPRRAWIEDRCRPHYLTRSQIATSFGTRVGLHQLGCQRPDDEEWLTPPSNLLHGAQVVAGCELLKPRRSENVMALGRTDAPCVETGKDLLSTHDYAAGLAKFILDCETPLTIGVQGEWGSGKTSVMKMVRTELEKSGRNLLICWFDTWQYGAIGDDDALGLRLLIDLSKKLGESLSEDAAAMRIGTKLLGLLTAASSLAKRGAKTVGTAALAGTTNYISGGFIDGGTLASGLIRSDANEQVDLSELRDGFSKLVCHFVEKAGKDSGARVIVFVDDLDRIRPGRAVALLEVLKNFLEVDNCVFVIACDHDVVREGVRERLGITDPAKVDAFFHKLFQVPFQMPIGTYDNRRFIQDYIANMLRVRTKQQQLRKTKIADTATRATELVNEAITIAIGTNPRALKRFFNIADLMLCVEGERSQSVDESVAWLDEHQISTYLALVSMHSRWSEVAAYMAGIKTAAELMRTIKTIVEEAESEDQVDEDFEGLLQTKYAPPGRPDEWNEVPEVQALAKFLVELLKILDRQRDNKVDESEFKSFQQWLGRLRLAVGGPQLSYKTSFFKLRDLAIKLSPEAGDAFFSLIRALDTRYGRDRRFNIVRLDSRYFLQIHNIDGSLVAPITFYIKKEGENPHIFMKVTLKPGPAGLDQLANEFVESTKNIGVPWIKSGQSYKLDFIQARPPQEIMARFREEVIKIHDQCATAVLTAVQSPATSILIPKNDIENIDYSGSRKPFPDCDEEIIQIESEFDGQNG